MEEPPSKIVRRFPGVTLETYLKLWQELEKMGIQELPSGEFWRYREVIEAQGSKTGIRLSEVDPTDYKEHLAPKDLVEIRVRVKQREHGFLRYHPENLTDRRYSRVHEAIWLAAELDKILREFITKTTEKPASAPQNGLDVRMKNRVMKNRVGPGRTEIIVEKETR